MKYIVYCTTNKVNNYIYIGVHKTENPNVFDYYYGCGVWKNDKKTYIHPKTKFQYAIKEYGFSNFIRNTIKVFDNSEDAYFLEAELVDEEFLKRPDVYNMVLGGRGGSDAEAIKTYQYDENGNFIKEYCSINYAARAMNRNMKTIWRAIKWKIKAAGYFWATVKYEKLDLTNYKTENISQGIPLYQYSDNGEFECCYDSITTAAKLLNVNKSNLQVSIKVGTKCNNHYFSTVYSPNFAISKTEKIKITKVYQYDLTGNFIQEWSSALQARKQLGFTSDIYKAIKLGRTAGGFQWSLEKLDSIAPVKPKSGKSRPIGKYDLNGNLIKTYPTAKTAKDENGGGVGDVLRGRYKTHKGYIYKYLD